VFDAGTALERRYAITLYDLDYSTTRYTSECTKRCIFWVRKRVSSSIVFYTHHTRNTILYVYNVFRGEFFCRLYVFAVVPIICTLQHTMKILFQIPSRMNSSVRLTHDTWQRGPTSSRLYIHTHTYTNVNINVYNIKHTHTYIYTYKIPTTLCI